MKHLQELVEYEKSLSPFFCQLVPFLVSNCFQQTGALKQEETQTDLDETQSSSSSE